MRWVAWVAGGFSSELVSSTVGQFDSLSVRQPVCNQLCMSVHLHSSAFVAVGAHQGGVAMFVTLAVSYWCLIDFATDSKERHCLPVTFRLRCCQNFAALVGAAMPRSSRSTQRTRRPRRPGRGASSWGGAGRRQGRRGYGFAYAAGAVPANQQVLSFSAQGSLALQSPITSGSQTAEPPSSVQPNNVRSCRACASLMTSFK